MLPEKHMRGYEQIKESPAKPITLAMEIICADRKDLPPTIEKKTGCK